MHRDDLRIAALATVPERYKELPITLASLRRQVDVLCVYLNGHDKVPDCVHRYADAWAHSSEHGNRGDGGKFFWSFITGPHFYLSCDDDFLYKRGYVEHHVDAVLRLESAVSLHGVVLADALAQGAQGISWLRGGRRAWYRAIDYVPQDQSVHILGTGVACHHSDLVTVTPNLFVEPHSADIWFSSACQKQGVRRYVAAHMPQLAEQICPPLAKGPKDLRWSGEYSRRVASRAPWTL